MGGDACNLHGALDTGDSGLGVPPCPVLSYWRVTTLTMRWPHGESHPDHPRQPKEAPAHRHFCDFGPFLFLLETPTSEFLPDHISPQGSAHPCGPVVPRVCSVPVALSPSAVTAWTPRQLEARRAGRSCRAWEGSLQGQPAEKVAPRGPLSLAVPFPGSKIRRGSDSRHVCVCCSWEMSECARKLPVCWPAR